MLRERARWALRMVTPWGIEHARTQRALLRARRELEARRAALAPPPGTRVEEVIRFLVGRGLDDIEVREGSIPESSLDFLAEHVRDRLPADRAVRALHIGNFVGVSLAYISWLVVDRHPESVVVSIDPNLPHRRVDDPRSHLLAMLDHFNLLDHNLVITGFTLDRAWADLHPAAARASADALTLLTQIAGPRFDLILTDGNHEEAYLKREIDALRALLAPNGILVFDDIKDWPGVKAVFTQTAREEEFEELGDDGRVGLLQLRAAPP